MTKRNIPKAPAFHVNKVHTDIAPSALSRWEHDIKAKDEGDEATISIFGAIGEDFFGEGVTAKRISAALRNIGSGRDVVVNINSPGGNVFEGIAIYNLFREHKGAVTMKVLGVAASAASFIAMAGDSVQIAKSGFLMIHNVFVAAIGDKHDMREIADTLDTFDKVLVDIYEARSKLDAKAITKMMDKETWIDGTKAVEDGFADSLLPQDAVAKDAKAAADATYNAAAKLDQLLAKAGSSRSERKKLIAAIKSGTQTAADDTTHNASVDEGLLAQLSKIVMKV